MSISWLIRVTLIFGSIGCGIASFTAQCFTTRFNQAISNADPVAELFELKLQDCLNYCILNAAKAGDGCASVVYHKEYNTCQIYGQDGTMGGSQIVAAQNHDYYNRTSFIGACQDRVVPRRGYQQRPRQYSVRTVNEPFPGPPSVLVSSKDSSEQSKEESVVVESIDRQLPVVDSEAAEAVEALRLKHLADILDADEETPAEATATFYNPVMTNVCTKREVVSYFVLFGRSLSAKVRPAKLRGVDQSSCIMYCSQNINATGSKSPCYAANYDPAREELAEDPNIIFADKFCMQTQKDCSADSPYVVYLHKQMTKKIISHYPDVHSIVACMALCIDHGHCKAVTYKEGGLCILHAGSPALDPKLIVDGSSQTMVVENGCQTSARAVPSLLSGRMERMEPAQETPEAEASEWGEWSGCQFGSRSARLRSRTRECYSDNCDDLQMEACKAGEY
ncbi:unnamed protein product, partial [Mesorhabditis spiculigera]